MYLYDETFMSWNVVLRPSKKGAVNMPSTSLVSEQLGGREDAVCLSPISSRPPLLFANANNDVTHQAFVR